jgi:hypothetical protein
MTPGSHPLHFSLMSGSRATHPTTTGRRLLRGLVREVVRLGRPAESMTEWSSTAHGAVARSVLTGAPRRGACVRPDIVRRSQSPGPESSTLSALRLIRSNSSVVRFPALRC